MERITSTTRTGLLETATRLVLDEGAVRVTLEAVAKTAGVSKGRPLYHPPSKDTLVEGLVERCATTCAAQVATLAAEEKGPQALLRTYVRATFAETSTSKALSAAVLGAVLFNPSLLLRYRTARGRCSRPGAQRPLRLAVNGFWIGELLGVAAFLPAARAELEWAMLELLGEQTA